MELWMNEQINSKRNAKETLYQDFDICTGKKYIICEDNKKYGKFPEVRISLRTEGKIRPAGW
jgi:hypothetical protein